MHLRLATAPDGASLCMDTQLQNSLRIKLNDWIAHANTSSLKEARKYFMKALSIDPETVIAKVFLEEVIIYFLLVYVYDDLIHSPG